MKNQVNIYPQFMFYVFESASEEKQIYKNWIFSVADIYQFK